MGRSWVLLVGCIALSLSQLAMSRRFSSSRKLGVANFSGVVVDDTEGFKLVSVFFFEPIAHVDAIIGLIGCSIVSHSFVCG